MGSLHLLDGARIERLGQAIHSNLSALRQRKRMLSIRNARPDRSPALDRILQELQDQRLQLDTKMNSVKQGHILNPTEDQAFARAQEIQRDLAEMIDLLIWFGAELPPAETSGKQAEC